jgi:hypothetical protein
MKNILLGLLLILFTTPGIFGQQYSSFEYVYATAGSPSIRVVTVEFRDGQGVKLKFEHDLDLTGNRLDRTLTLTSGYMKSRNQSTIFTAHRGYYTSVKGRATPQVAALLDELVQLMPATGAGNDLDNDRSLQRGVVANVLRLNQLLVGNQVEAPVLPRNAAADAPRGDGFAAFYANFKRAVLSNDRTSVKNMMSPVFLWALGDEESPEKALRGIDSKQWQQLRVAVSRLPVRCKQPCLGNSGYSLNGRQLGELVFAQENGRWKWKGLLGD